MSDFLSGSDPSLTPPPPSTGKTYTTKQLGAGLFFLAAIALFIGVIIAPSTKESTPVTTTTSTTQAPVYSAPVVNKYDAYLEHVYNNSGQANTLTKAKLIEYGDIICQALDSGRSIAWIVNYLSTNSTGQSDNELYASVVYGAITYICDEYKGDLNLYLNN